MDEWWLSELVLYCRWLELVSTNPESLLCVFTKNSVTGLCTRESLSAPYILMMAFADGFQSRYSQIWFAIKCMFPNWRDWDIHYTQKGLWKQRMSRLLALVGFIVLLLNAYRVRQLPKLVNKASGFTYNTTWRVLNILKATFRE